MKNRVAESLRLLFRGAQGVYGTYAIDTNFNGNGKANGKALTIKRPVTQELWDAHVEGKQSIGIIPIREDNTCGWGCIDVDQYPPPTASILKKIREKKLPLNPCFSKSGGLHLFMFAEPPVEAKIMQTALRNLAVILGLSRCEIFPKQIAVDYSKNEIGNWLNMPFFGETRLGLTPDGKQVKATGFLEHIIKADATKLAKQKPKTDEAAVPDGPPCLQAICAEPITADAHNRNNVLMAMSVYYRKAYPDDWESRISIFNSDYLRPPLPAGELDGIRKRVREKDYTYQCSQDPLRGYCNRPVCLTRKYGIQGGQGEMVIDNVTQIKSGRESLWLIRMNGVGLLELDTPSLMSPTKFAEQYFNTFRTMPPVMKREEWNRVVSNVGEQAIVVEVQSFSPEDKFVELLRKFVAKKQRPEKEAVLRDGVWVDKGVAWFTSSALSKFLELQRFTELSPGRLNNALKNSGAQFRHLRIGAVVRSAIRIPVPEEQPAGELPDLEEDEI